MVLHSLSGHAEATSGSLQSSVWDLNRFEAGDITQHPALKSRRRNSRFCWITLLWLCEDFANLPNRLVLTERKLFLTWIRTLTSISSFSVTSLPIFFVTCSSTRCNSKGTNRSKTILNPSTKKELRLGRGVVTQAWIVFSKLLQLVYRVKRGDIHAESILVYWAALNQTSVGIHQ